MSYAKTVAVARTYEAPAPKAQGMYEWSRATGMYEWVPSIKASGAPQEVDSYRLAQSLPAQGTMTAVRTAQNLPVQPQAQWQPSMQPTTQNPAPVYVSTVPTMAQQPMKRSRLLTWLLGGAVVLGGVAVLSRKDDAP